MNTNIVNMRKTLWPIKTICYAIFSLIFISLILTTTQPAHAQNSTCQPGNVVILPTEPYRQLNSPLQPSVIFHVTRLLPSVACEYWVGFTRGLAPTYDRFLYRGSLTLDYDIYKSTSTAPINLKSYPEAVTENEVYRGEFERGAHNPGTHTYTMRPRVLPPYPGPFSIRAPGVYTDNVQIKVFKGSFPPSGAPQEIAAVNQSFYYEVEPIAIVSFLDTGVPYTDPPITIKTIDFGQMSTGQRRQFDMVLLYNSGYRVTFASQNGSKMKHTVENAFIPYSMRIDGIQKTLPPGHPVEVASGSGMSPSAPDGKRMNIEITIGNTHGSWAGNYGDSITVVMTSL